MSETPPIPIAESAIKNPLAVNPDALGSSLRPALMRRAELTRKREDHSYRHSFFEDLSTISFDQHGKLDFRLKEGKLTPLVLLPLLDESTMKFDLFAYGLLKNPTVRERLQLTDEAIASLSPTQVEAAINNCLPQIRQIEIATARVIFDDYKSGDSDILARFAQEYRNRDDFPLVELGEMVANIVLDTQEKQGLLSSFRPADLGAENQALANQAEEILEKLRAGAIPEAVQRVTPRIRASIEEKAAEPLAPVRGPEALSEAGSALNTIKKGRVEVAEATESNEAADAAMAKLMETRAQTGHYEAREAEALHELLDSLRPKLAAKTPTIEASRDKFFAVNELVGALNFQGDNYEKDRAERLLEVEITALTQEGLATADIRLITKDLDTMARSVVPTVREVVTGHADKVERWHWVKTRFGQNNPLTAARLCRLMEAEGYHFPDDLTSIPPSNLEETQRWMKIGKVLSLIHPYLANQEPIPPPTPLPETNLSSPISVSDERLLQTTVARALAHSDVFREKERDENNRSYADHLYEKHFRAAFDDQGRIHLDPVKGFEASVLAALTEINPGHPDLLAFGIICEQKFGMASDFLKTLGPEEISGLVRETLPQVQQLEKTVLNPQQIDREVVYAADECGKLIGRAVEDVNLFQVSLPSKCRELCGYAIEELEKPANAKRVQTLRDNLNSVWQQAGCFDLENRQKLLSFLSDPNIGLYDVGSRTIIAETAEFQENHAGLARIKDEVAVDQAAQALYFNYLQEVYGGKGIDTEGLRKLSETMARYYQGKPAAIVLNELNSFKITPAHYSQKKEATCFTLAMLASLGGTPSVLETSPDLLKEVSHRKPGKEKASKTERLIRVLRPISAGVIGVGVALPLGINFIDIIHRPVEAAQRGIDRNIVQPVSEKIARQIAEFQALTAEAGNQTFGLMGISFWHEVQDYDSQVAEKLSNLKNPESLSPVHDIPYPNKPPEEIKAYFEAENLPVVSAGLYDLYREGKINFTDSTIPLTASLSVDDLNSTATSLAPKIAALLKEEVAEKKINPAQGLAALTQRPVNGALVTEAQAVEQMLLFLNKDHSDKTGVAFIPAMEKRRLPYGKGTVHVAVFPQMEARIARQSALPERQVTEEIPKTGGYSLSLDIPEDSTLKAFYEIDPRGYYEALHDFPALLDKLRAGTGGITRFYTKSGDYLGAQYQERREYIKSIKEIPQSLINATIAIENVTFQEDAGVDTSGLLRAVLKGYGGGSTLTMQLVKMALNLDQKKYDDPRMDYKMEQIMLALGLKAALTDQLGSETDANDEILRLYFNYANYGGMGLSYAAKFYFGK